MEGLALGCVGLRFEGLWGLLGFSELMGKPQSSKFREFFGPPAPSVVPFLGKKHPG